MRWVQPDYVEATWFLAEEAIERAAKRSAKDVEAEGRQRPDGDHSWTPRLLHHSRELSGSRHAHNFPRHNGPVW